VEEKGGKLGVTEQDIGKLVDGKKVYIYTLTNDNGLRMQVSNYGGLLGSIEIPDRNGDLADIIIGPSLKELIERNDRFWGGLIGRYANRIAEGKITLDGKEYQLTQNEGRKHLHGGVKAFHKVVWDSEMTESADRVGVKLTRLSPDGEEGYPGNLSVTVTYELTNDNEFVVNYEAETDKPTIVNLTSHGYFNIGGHKSGDCLAHVIYFNADHYTPVDKDLIPTGEIKSDKGTPYDFTKPITLGESIANMAKAGGDGFDQNFALTRKGKDDHSLIKAMSIHDPKSGRFMEIFTTEPGLQLYSGQFMDGTTKGKDGALYSRHSGLNIEMHNFPDSPNRSNFPSPVLRPGEKYKQRTIHKFSVK